MRSNTFTFYNQSQLKVGQHISSGMASAPSSNKFSYKNSSSGFQPYSTEIRYVTVATNPSLLLTSNGQNLQFRSIIELKINSGRAKALQYRFPTNFL